MLPLEHVYRVWICLYYEMKTWSPLTQVEYSALERTSPLRGKLCSQMIEEISKIGRDGLLDKCGIMFIIPLIEPLPTHVFQMKTPSFPIEEKQKESKTDFESQCSTFITLSTPLRSDRRGGWAIRSLHLFLRIQRPLIQLPSIPLQL
ncbi:hypothetical protein NPIL_396521 [Nephila pilipes]|uniref:Uncharacterized protein n=1 Tax=Nephila pilipes TaxID=299642 RepID=A0A8X6N0L0_NEPPI|nr:hypothetical protein NPIL_396521 [Nephila pilipes]